jgi:hypothetical protein
MNDNTLITIFKLDQNEENDLELYREIFKEIVDDSETLNAMELDDETYINLMEKIDYKQIFKYYNEDLDDSENLFTNEEILSILKSFHFMGNRNTLELIVVLLHFFPNLVQDIINYRTDITSEELITFIKNTKILNNFENSCALNDLDYIYYNITDETFEIAVEYNVIKLVKYIFRKYHVAQKPKEMNNAIKTKNIDLINMLIERDFPTDIRSLKISLETGIPEIFELILKYTGNKREQVFYDAVETKNEKFVEICFNNRVCPIGLYMSDAVETENVEIVRLFIDNLIPIGDLNLSNVIDKLFNCNENVRSEITNMCFSYGVPCNEETLNLSVICNFINIAEYCFEQDFQPDNKTMIFAIRTKNENMVELCFDHDVSYEDSKIMKEAILTGNVKIVQLLLDNLVSYNLNVIQTQFRYIPDEILNIL